MGISRGFRRIEKKVFVFKKKYYFFYVGILFASLVLLFKTCGSDIAIRSEYKIGQDSRWRGLNFLGKQQNFTAFNNELFKKIGKDESIQFHMIPMHTNELITSLDQGKVEGILTTLKPTTLSESIYVFSQPYFLTGPVLVISKDISKEQWDEIPKKIIGAEANSANQTDFELLPSMTIKFYDDVLSAFSDLSGGKIDGVIFPAILAHTYVKTFYENELKIVTLPLNNEGLRLLVKKTKDGEELVQQFDKGLDKIKKNGDYDRILERWGLIDVNKVNLSKTE